MDLAYLSIKNCVLRGISKMDIKYMELRFFLQEFIKVSSITTKKRVQGNFNG